MDSGSTLDLVVPENFIQATRDSGYKSLGAAIAELVDNALEAKAKHVRIKIEKVKEKDGDDVRVTIADDGRGMDSETLRHSLQFGWSSRFNNRKSFGRYGMGLPNASLSNARRVDIWSSVDGEVAMGSRLDVDEVVSHGMGILPAAPVAMPLFLQLCESSHGTVVVWSKCDRLMNRKLGPLARRLRAELGRLFRYQLWAGKVITVNAEKIVPFDPLFTKKGTNLIGAQPFGPELAYEVVVPAGGQRPNSTVRVTFTELPIREWHGLSNAQKNEHGIAKNAGVSVVRAGREIDRGWFFMGQKRKENYDDWWRCEVRFQPDLDELFGVTHTKQEIHPTEKLLSILVPDLERIARELNGRARRTFTEVKADMVSRTSELVAERRDSLLEPPSINGNGVLGSDQLVGGVRGRIRGLHYRMKAGPVEDGSFYEATIEGARITVVLNEAHPVVEKLLNPNISWQQHPEKTRRDIELMILAAARTEVILSRHKKAKTWIKKFRQSWSRVLATFLT